MPTYEITSPDGKTWEVTAPEGASQDDVLAYAKKQFAKPKAVDKFASVDPTEGMSFGEKALAGAGKAIVDTGRGIAGLFGANNKEAIEESRRLDAPLMKTGAGLTGNIGAQVLMALAPGAGLKGSSAAANALGFSGAAGKLAQAGSAAVAPTTLKGAAALGGAYGLAQPAIDSNERLNNALLGGVAGASGQGVFNALARVVSPEASRSAARGLLDQGITPTPGQLLGGGFKRSEDALTSVPVVGDAIKKGQRRAVAELNVSALNRALEPIGEKLPKTAKVGREAIEHVERTLSSKYENLMPSLTTQADGQFIQEIQGLRNMMADGSIDPLMAKRFENILNNQLLVKFKGDTPTLTGQTLKQVESDLGRLSRQFRSSADPDQRLLGDAIRETQDILRETVLRSNPQAAKELKAINEGYANFKRVQRAASYVGAEDGMFSAAQLQQAVRSMDKSKDKASFARGNALMQDLSGPAKSVLGSSVPDSGTPLRSLLALAAGGGAAAIHPGLAAGVAAAPLMYSRPAQNALAALIAKRPDAAIPVANALRGIAPYAALPSSVYANK